MKKKLFCAFCLTLLSCIKKENAPSEIAVDLQPNSIDNPFAKSLLPLGFVDDSKSSEFKGIPNKDSSFIMELNTIRSRDIEKLEIKGLKPERNSIFVLSGFNQDNQYYILDLNNNKDFSDDEKVKFEKDIINQNNYRTFFNIHKIKMSTFEGNKLNNRFMHLQFLPAPDYFTYDKENEKKRFKQDLQLAALKHDYLYGTFEIEDKTYAVGVNKAWNNYEFVFKDKDTIFHSSSDQGFAKYRMHDTLKFGDKHFRIDSSNIFPLNFKLTKVKMEGILYGFRTNEVSKNYQVTDLNGNKTTFKKLVQDKSFLLLDFWGTWCVPCKELTPEIVQLNQKYKDEVQFVSLAFEMDPKPVSKYVTKNGMNWYNGIIKGKPKSGDISSPILRGLRIECYPTFIVLDSDLNILFRVCGGSHNFANLKDFLNKTVKN